MNNPEISEFLSRVHSNTERVEVTKNVKGFHRKEHPPSFHFGGQAKSAKELQRNAYGPTGNRQQ
jgi:hypothetical protein